MASRHCNEHATVVCAELQISGVKLTTHATSTQIRDTATSNISDLYTGLYIQVCTSLILYIAPIIC